MIAQLQCANCSMETHRLAAFQICWKCFHEPDVLEEFAEEARVGERPLPPRPTSALPGTRTKVHVLAARHEAGYQLWHEADAKVGDETTLPGTGPVPLRRRWTFTRGRGEGSIRVLKLPA